MSELSTVKHNSLHLTLITYAVAWKKSDKKSFSAVMNGPNLGKKYGSCRLGADQFGWNLAF